MLCANLTCRRLPLELLLADDEALVTTLRYEVDPIVGFDCEGEFPSFDREQLHCRGDFQPRRRGRVVTHIDVRPDRLFPGPVEMRVDRPYACPLDEPDEESRREDLGHHDEL